MGTGGVGSAIARFPFAADSDAIKFIATVFFLLNLSFFILITGATVARYAIYPEVGRTFDCHFL